MRLGVFARTFEGSSPEAVLKAARRAGFETVQYNLACSGLGPLPRVIPEGACQAIRAAMAETGVSIAAVSATYNMVHPDRAERDGGRQSFAAIAGIARGMGTRLVTVCTGSRNPHDQWRAHPDNASRAAWRDLCREFEDLIAIAERYDLLLGVEPELGNVVDSPLRARELFDALRSDRLRIVLDPANLFERASPERRRALVEAAIDLLADRIQLAHAKDRDADGRFVAAGQGGIDFPHFLGRLRRSGFEGAVIAHGFAEREAPGVATFLRTQLAQLDGQA